MQRFCAGRGDLTVAEVTGMWQHMLMHNGHACFCSAQTQVANVDVRSTCVILTCSDTCWWFGCKTVSEQCSGTCRWNCCSTVLGGSAEHAGCQVHSKQSGACCELVYTGCCEGTCMQGDAGVHVCVPYAMQHMDVAFLLLVNSNGMQLQDHNL